MNMVLDDEDDDLKQATSAIYVSSYDLMQDMANERQQRNMLLSFHSQRDTLSTENRKNKRSAKFLTRDSDEDDELLEFEFPVSITRKRRKLNETHAALPVASPSPLTLEPVQATHEYGLLLDINVNDLPPLMLDGGSEAQEDDQDEDEGELELEATHSLSTQSLPLEPPKLYRSTAIDMLALSASTPSPVLMPATPPNPDGSADCEKQEISHRFYNDRAISAQQVRFIRWYFENIGRSQFLPMIIQHGYDDLDKFHTLTKKQCLHIFGKRIGAALLLSIKSEISCKRSHPKSLLHQNQLFAHDYYPIDINTFNERMQDLNLSSPILLSLHSHSNQADEQHKTDSNPHESSLHDIVQDEDQDDEEEEEEEEEEEDEDEQQNAEDEEEEESSSDEEINTKSMKLSPPKQQTKRVKKKRPSLTENEKAFNKLHTQFDPSLIGTVPVSQINEKTKAKQQQRNKKRNTEPISVHSQRQKQLQKEGLIKVGSPSSLQSPNVGKSIRDNDNNNDEDKKENHKAGNSSKKPSASSSAAAAKAKGKQKYNVLPELHRGTALLKYGRRGYPHFRQFNITADNENLRWFSSKKKLQQSSINVGCINEILTGQHTKEFRRIAWTTLTPASFSVIYDNKKKSLNLVAKSVDEMKMWVESLRVLRDKKRRGEHLAKLESLEIDVDFRDRNRPQSRHHSGNFLRSHETKEREVDPILQRKLIDDIAALRKQFQEIAREANNEIVQSTKEYESVEQILSELEERIEELDHEVRNTRNTKIAENDVWRTRIDLESLREKIKVITKQSKAQYKSSKRRWSVF